MSYPRLASRLYNQPLLIEPGKAEVVEAVFRAYAEGRPSDLPKFEAAEQPQLAIPIALRRTDNGYLLSDAGIAVLPVHGTLVQRAGNIDAASGLTGYNQLAARLQAAMADPEVSGVLLEIDSPGGEAAGVWDLAAQIAQATKPVVAHANEMAFSAAYALAAAAPAGLYLPEAGMVGSVGVIMMHVDQSALDAKRGLVYTPIFAGKRKADFSPHAPLSDRARAAAQDQVDRLYQIFVDQVARDRGIDASVVKKTEAGLLTPGQAIDLRMADGQASFAETLQILTDRVSAPGFTGYGFTQRRVGANSSEGAIMANDPKAPAPTAATEEQLNTARADGRAEGVAQATAELTPKIAEASAAATTAERDRIAGILTHAEASGRRALAEHLAFKTGATIADAAALLAAAPKETAAANPLAAAMANVPNPQVGAAADAAPTASAPRVSSSADIFEMRRRASGHTA